MKNNKLIIITKYYHVMSQCNVVVCNKSVNIYKDKQYRLMISISNNKRFLLFFKKIVLKIYKRK